MAAATSFFREHFVSPATATLTELKNGAQNSITRADISGFLTNAVVCFIPLIAGGGTAYAINQYAHKHWVPEERKIRPLISLSCTVSSVIAGAAISFFVIKLLSASHITLTPLTADKALRLETLHVVLMAMITPLSLYFRVPLFGFYNVPAFLGTAAVSGYFGERSLYVIGLLSALNFGVQAALPKPPQQGSWRLYSDDDLVKTDHYA